MRLAALETRSESTGAIRSITPDLLASTFLAPRPLAYDVAGALAVIPAPWSASFAAAPDEVTELVEDALRDLAMATPGMTVEALDLSTFPAGRAHDHLAALRQLWDRLGDAVPADLVPLRHALNSGAEDALETLPVSSVPCPFETRAELDLREHLSRLFGTAPEATGGRAPLGALGHIQQHLLCAAEPVLQDGTVSIFGLRDARDEVAFVAARAQALIAGGMAPRDIGILAPNDAIYLAAMPSAFGSLGLHLSGMPSASGARDHVGELLANLLVAMKGPAPRMALASIALSPLLPLDRQERHNIANELASRGWSATVRTTAAAEIFEEMRPATNPRQLLAKLVKVARLITDKEALLTRINGIRAILSGEHIDWVAITRLAAPRSGAPDHGERFIEGVTVLGEASLPWRQVRHLFILGLAGANWPRPASGSPFFTESELEVVRTNTGIALPSRSSKIARRLELFRRQLGAASEGVTLTVPARDLDGKALAPATALSLIARAFGVAKISEMIRDPLSAIEAAIVQSRLVEWRSESLSARLPHSGEVALPADPFRLHLDETGIAKPQSPTRLETLLISPLAWLLGELGAVDMTWSPERLDVLMLGTIVHAALEKLFPAGGAVPDRDALEASIGAALDEAISREAGWLDDPAWAAERANLLREVRMAARGWSRFSIDNGATVRAVETWLKGDHPTGISVRGKSDCLVELPDGRIIVVDHKRSSSGKRRTRMEAGADLQVELYRIMIALSAEFDGIAHDRIVPAYHCTIDGGILAGAAGAGLKGARMLEGDIGSEAARRLEEHVARLAQGRLPLNVEGDVEAFEKLGITPYPLKDNPLVTAFMMPAASGQRPEIDDVE